MTVSGDCLAEQYRAAESARKLETTVVTERGILTRVQFTMWWNEKLGSPKVYLLVGVIATAVVLALASCQPTISGSRGSIAGTSAGTGTTSSARHPSAASLSGGEAVVWAQVTGCT